MTQMNAPQQDDENAEASAATDDPEQAVAAEAPEGDASTEDDPLTLLRAELAETKDRMLRAMADVENTRRRATRDADEARKYAVTGFARELLEVADNLSRALQSVPEEAKDNEQVKPLIEGIELTQKSLAVCFERQKITKVEPTVGDRFDHNQHQAMFETESADHPPGSIIQVMQFGYVIADRLLRPALVGVSKKPAVVQEPANDTGDGERGHAVDTSA
ncbi:MAG: nucleotide exchange factor GrpE [Pseudomonadota bacterium]